MSKYNLNWSEVDGELLMIATIQAAQGVIGLHRLPPLNSYTQFFKHGHRFSMNIDKKLDPTLCAMLQMPYQNHADCFDLLSILKSFKPKTLCKIDVVSITCSNK